MKTGSCVGITLKGIGVSPGIVIGKALIIPEEGVEVPAFCHLEDSFLLHEIERFKRAVKISQEQLQRLRAKILQNKKGREHVHIIDAYIMMLYDEMLIEDTIKTIKREKVNAEWALKMVLRGIREFFDKTEDEYLRERGADIEHIGDRILRNLIGKRRDKITDIDEEVIVVAKDLAPTDTVQLSKDKVKGFVTVMGGRTSHTAIVARSMEIPAVVGLENIMTLLRNGDTVIVDGTSGTVVINPSMEVIREYEWHKKQFFSYEKSLHNYSELPAETIDGKRIRLMGNVEFLNEIGQLTDHGAEGIGLYRTEFLYLGRTDLPTEEEHLSACKKVAERVSPHPTIIRTLDLGGDKFTSNLGYEKEVNPAMGLRAIRLCMKRPDVFKTQLKGILRASVFGNIKIMFPMISGVAEFLGALKVFEEAKSELRREKKPFDPDVEVGIMIEVPSAAIVADHLAKHVAFFSIGTNDLLQYCLAIDRGNEHVDYLYEPLHPALLRTIKGVIDVANRAGIDVSVCGEMAGDPSCTMALLALGLKQLSMNALAILRVKKIVRSIRYSDMMSLGEKILEFSTTSEVESYINYEMKSRFEGVLI